MMFRSMPDNGEHTVDISEWINFLTRGDVRIQEFDRQKIQTSKHSGVTMKIRQSIIIIFICFVFYGPVGFVSNSRSGTTVDHNVYAELLNKYVHQGKVDYKGFKTDESKLDQYLKVLENVDPESLSRNERFAFYINAYNAWTIKLILSGYPGVESIKDLGNIFQSPWKKKICRIDGDVITLDDIEHNILRPEFKDPRVHFAINCAALSCPPLGSQPFLGSTLDQQLDEATRRFVNNPKRNYLDGETLYVSKIFDWFGKDFNYDVAGFFLNYAEDHLKRELEVRKDKINVKYLHYDWSLNGK